MGHKSFQWDFRDACGICYVVGYDRLTALLLVTGGLRIQRHQDFTRLVETITMVTHGALLAEDNLFSGWISSSNISALTSIENIARPNDVISDGLKEFSCKVFLPGTKTAKVEKLNWGIWKKTDQVRDREAATSQDALQKAILRARYQTIFWYNATFSNPRGTISTGLSLLWLEHGRQCMGTKCGHPAGKLWWFKVMCPCEVLLVYVLAESVIINSLILLMCNFTYIVNSTWLVYTHVIISFAYLVTRPTQLIITRIIWQTLFQTLLLVSYDYSI